MSNEKLESYHDLPAWKSAHDLTVSLYKIKSTKKIYQNLAAKIRDLAAAVPANIAVGFRKRNRSAKLHFYHAALTAAEELSYYFRLADDLGALKNIKTFENSLDNLQNTLMRMIRSIPPTK